MNSPHRIQPLDMACQCGIMMHLDRSPDPLLAHEPVGEQPSAKPFTLIWTSQNGAVTLERGQYASITEAAAALPAAKARLQAEYPASTDTHFPHDIEAGTWRVIPTPRAPIARHRP